MDKNRFSWNLSVWSEKLRKLGNGRQRLLILFLAGLLLVVLSIPVKEKGPADSIQTQETQTQGMSGDGEIETYRKNMEKTLVEVLRKIDGVGEVSVMITLKSTGEKVVEKDQNHSSDTVEETDSAGGSRTTQSQNSEKSSIYTQSGQGTQDPYVKKELVPETEGVLIVADGGDDPVVVENLTEAVRALFGIEAHKIKIVKREHSK